MKFLADAMLGRLAKWLRVLGHDTAYFPQLEDDQLIRLARAEGRTLLTRDRDLTRRKGVRSLLIESDRFEEQLGQLLRDLNLDCTNQTPRCPRCNAALLRVTKEDISARVPGYVLSRHSDFTRCPRCDKVYWKGTHWQRMRERIDAIRERGFTPS
jgi:uncharacterized protein with PIN domain